MLKAFRGVAQGLADAALEQFAGRHVLPRCHQRGATPRTALRYMGTDRFDYLDNNAGTSHHASVENTTEDELDALYNVHFMGVFFLTPALLPLMNDAGQGRERFVRGHTHYRSRKRPYGAMKASVETLTKYIALELGPRRIAVNVVALGAIATKFSGGMVRDHPEVNKRVAEATALGRVGEPEAIGLMIAALLSDENRWVNG